jgi:hypothetical protein
MALARQTNLAFGGRFFVDMHAFGLLIAAFLLFCYCAKWAAAGCFEAPLEKMSVRWVDVLYVQ